ncbi:MAG TPA: hypothetical protein VHB25_05675 [Gemmatimonadaceae bacterium]|nr:hypothetical protein [Gemmatimonadaceae bacterium]
MAVFAIACGHDATAACPPIGYACALRAAVDVQVVSAVGGAAVDSVSMQATGPVTAEAPCSGSVCTVYGNPGDYQLTISAPGYQPVHLEVMVHAAETPKCGCPSVQTEQRTVSLTPLGSS